MKHKIYLLLLVIIMCESSLFGQLQYTFPQFWHETGDFIKTPGNWQGSDWLKLGLVGAGSILIMETIDQPIRTLALKDPSYYKTAPMVFGRMWGELYSPVVLFSGFAAYSLIANDIGSRKIAYEIGQASLYAGAINYLLKLAIGRARPYMDEGKTSFRPFTSFFNINNQSFPGGHSTAAFVISTVLSRNAKPTWLKVLAYLPAVLTFVSRIYQDQHWTSDDFAGAACGYFIATWVVDHHENSKSSVETSFASPLSIHIAF
jgi:membrane-associated phospholipid phosphatase